MATPNFTILLQDAVNKPGSIMQAYSAFHHYSLGNQLLALFECNARGIEPGPINTFLAWKELGRYVKKGERAITLCMPVTVKRRDLDGNGEFQQPKSDSESDGQLHQCKYNGQLELYAGSEWLRHLHDLRDGQ